MKDKVLKTAEKVITRRGTKFTMDELAAALNMSKRTLYEQFASKEELIETIFLVRMDRWEEYHHKLMEDAEIPVERFLHDYFIPSSKDYPIVTSELLGLLLRHYPNVKEKLLARSENEWKRLEAYLTRQNEAGNITTPDVQVLIFILQSLMVFATSKYVENNDAKQYMKSLEDSIAVVLTGILPKK